MKIYKLLLAATVAMTVAVTPARADWSSGVAKVMLDPGHGGNDPGAGRSGYRYEADLVLDASLAMRDWLRNHGAGSHNLRLTRETNVTVDLSPRRQMSINFDPWVFCSVHLNAFNGTAHGTETWYYWAGRSNTLAKYVQGSLVDKLKRADRGVKQNGWTVITGASYIPAVLTEGLFVDNIEENNMINSRDKAGFKNWVNGHLQGFYNFMTSSGEVSYNGNQGLSNPANDPWGGSGGTVAPPEDNKNLHPNPDWESKGLCKKNVFAYNIRINKDDKQYPRISYQLNGRTSWVKIHVYMNNHEVATFDGTTNQRNEVTLDLSNIKERGDVYFSIQARTAETTDAPSLIKDEVPSDWTSNWHLKFYNATGVTVNNCTDSPTFGRIIVVESHSCNTTGFVSSTQDNHGRGAMLYAITPQMQPIPNPDLKGVWGFNGARPNWNDWSNDARGTWTKARYSEDGRLFAATATSNEGQRGVYELTDDSSNGASLNAPERRVLSTSWPVTGLDVIGKGNDLRIAAFGPHHMVYAPDGDGWLDIDTYGTNDEPNLKIYWPNTGASKDISMSGYHWGHVDTQTLSVAFESNGNGMMLGNARVKNFQNYPIYMYVKDSEKKWPLSTWENVDGGAVAYNADRTIFAASGSKGEICLWRVNGQTGGVDNYSWIGSFVPEVGSSTRDIAFDYANNIYVTGDNCRKALNGGNYIGNAGMCAYQLPESWGGRVETWVSAPYSERITDFKPKGVVVNLKEVKWTGKNQQVADIYWEDIANDAGPLTGYTVMLNGRVYGDDSQIWPHSSGNPYHVTLDMFDRSVDGNDINNTIQVIPYYNGVAGEESNTLRIGHTDYDKENADAIRTNVTMGWNNGQQPVTITWNAPYNGDAYGYKLYRIVNGNTEQIKCPGDKDGIFPADRFEYKMADAGVNECKFRVDALMQKRLKLQNSEISDYIVGKESATIYPNNSSAKNRTAPTITELVNYQGRNGVRLAWSWDNGTEKPDYYRIERDGVVIVDKADYTSTIDMLVPDGNHTWKVIAHYNDGTELASEPASLIRPIKREMAYDQYGIEEIYNYPIMSEEQFAKSGRTYQNTIVPRNDSYFTDVPAINGSSNTSIRNFMMGESVSGSVGGLYRHGTYRKGYWFIAQLTNKSARSADVFDKNQFPDGYINYWDGTGCEGGVIRFNADDPLAITDFNKNRPRKLFQLEHAESQWVAADEGDNNKKTGTIGDWINLVTRRRGDNNTISFHTKTNYLWQAYYNRTGNDTNIDPNLLGKNQPVSNFIGNKWEEHKEHSNPSSKFPEQNVRVHYVSASGNIGSDGGYVYFAMCNMPGVLRQYWEGAGKISEEYIELPRHLGPARDGNGLIPAPENYAFPVEGRDGDFILQLRSDGYYYYNNKTGQYTQIMGEPESHTAGGITFTYNGEMFLLHPSSNSSNNIGHFRIDMPQRPTDASPYTDADFTDLIPMVTFTQKDLTGVTAKNSNSMWFGVEPAPAENCVYIYQYVPGFRMAKYRFYSYRDFPPVTPELKLEVRYDSERSKITHFEAKGNWDRPKVEDQGELKDYEWYDRTDYTLDHYRYKLLDPEMKELLSGDCESARDGRNNKIFEFPKDYAYNAAKGGYHLDNKVYTLQVQPVYKRINTGKFIDGEWASVQASVDYPAAIDPLTVNVYGNTGTNRIWRVDFNFDRASLNQYPDPVDYFTVEMEDGNGNWTPVDKLRIFQDGKMWVQRNDNTTDRNSPWYAGEEQYKNYLDENKIPGDYKFGGRGEPTGDETDKQPAMKGFDPVVGYTIMNFDPTGRKFRAVAHYAATNSFISKSPVAEATGKYNGTTAVDDLTFDVAGKVRIHPVPAQNDITVDSPEAIQSIVILSMSGAEVMHAEGNGEHSQTLNISHLPQGNYMLSVNGHAALHWIKH